jgi:hypothetical protein
MNFCELFITRQRWMVLAPSLLHNFNNKLHHSHILKPYTFSVINYIKESDIKKNETKKAET